jgi:hypothetical protein
MKTKLPVYIAISIVLLSSCSSTKTQTTTPTKVAEPVQKEVAKKNFTFSFYFLGSSTLTMPADEITVDTTGQMVFVTQQRLSDGSWTKPRGLAYLEPKDHDSLISFISDTEFFHINNEDVLEECAEGSDITFRLYRTDLTKGLELRTSTCASEYNLLVGRKRQLFKKFMAFFQDIRERYRPKIIESKKH